MKLIYAIFFAFLIASFYIEALDLFWQGCIPQICFCIAMLGFFSTLLIYTAAEVLNRLKEIKALESICFAFSCSNRIFSYHLSKITLFFLTDLNILLTLEFLVVYSLYSLQLSKVYLCKSICHSIVFIYNG